MKFKMAKLNNGFTLPGVVIVGTVIAISSVVFIQFVSHTIKAHKKVTKEVKIDSINNLVSSVLSNSDAARNTFSGLVPDNAYHPITLKQADGSILASPGPFSAEIEILSIQARLPVSSKVIEARQGDLKIESKQISSGQLNTEITPISIWVGVNNVWKAAYPGESQKAHIIFMTTATPDGSMGGVPGGLAGADSICQNEANLAGYGTNWSAVLGHKTVAAKSRVNVIGPVYNTRGELVAENSYDLWDGSIRSVVGYGINPANDYRGTWAFTGSDPYGQIDTAHIAPPFQNCCFDWTNVAGFTVSGNIGRGNDLDDRWIATYSSAGPISNPCTNTGRLYCLSH